VKKDHPTDPEFPDMDDQGPPVDAMRHLRRRRRRALRVIEPFVGW